MEQFLRQLQTIPEAAELIRRVEEADCARRALIWPESSVIWPERSSVSLYV